MLKKATLFSMIGISYIFLLRAIGTFYPHLFQENVLLVQLIELFLFLATSSIVLFFLFFLKDYVSEEQIKIKNVTILLLVASIAMLLVHLRGLIMVFNVKAFSFLSKLRSIEPVVPWISSILTATFFIVFYKNLNREQAILRKPIFLAAFASALMLFVRSLILFNYYVRVQGFRWFADLPQKIAFTLMPILTFNFAVMLYFFFIFYKHVGEIKLEGKP